MNSRDACDSTLWVVTDPVGNIQQLSSSTAAMLGLGAEAGKCNLLLFLPHHRAAILDMDIALSGLASVRTALLSPLAQRPISVRYVVTRQLRATRVLLHWSFELVRDIRVAS